MAQTMVVRMNSAGLSMVWHCLRICYLTRGARFGAADRRLVAVRGAGGAAPPAPPRALYMSVCTGCQKILRKMGGECSTASAGRGGVTA